MAYLACVAGKEDAKVQRAVALLHLPFYHLTAMLAFEFLLIKQLANLPIGITGRNGNVSGNIGACFLNYCHSP